MSTLPVHPLLVLILLSLLSLSTTSSSDHLFGFGNNNRDDLMGVGYSENILIPSRIGFGALYQKKIVSIAAGETHSVVVDEEGSMYSFGSSEVGALGIPGKESRYWPTVIQAFSSRVRNRMAWKRIVEVTGCWGPRTFVREEGTGNWFAFGRNDAFTLGDETDYQRETPTFVYLSKKRPDIIAITSGSEHTILLASDGSVFALGSCQHAQCGLGIQKGGHVRKPIKIDLSLEGGDQIMHVAAGVHHTLALSNASVLLGWGHNVYGQAGGGSEVGAVTVPTPIDTSSHLRAGEQIVKIRVGYFHNLLLTSVSRVLCFGQNEFGQCGTGLAIPHKLYKPTEVDDAPLHGGVPADIACGRDSSLILTSFGELFLFGHNIFAFYPANLYSPFHVPIAHLLTSNETIIQMVAGAYHCLLRTSKGAVLSFGGGREVAPLGVGHKESRGKLLPQVVGVDGVLHGAPVIHVSDSRRGIVFLDSHGNGVGVGQCAVPCSNVESQTNQIDLQKIYSIAAGLLHALFVTSEGHLFGEGGNFHGQLSLSGITANRPTLIEGFLGHQVVAVGAGNYHSIVLTSKGKVFGMGENQFGEIGCGCEDYQMHIPTPVVDAHFISVENVVEISVGSHHNVLRVANGSLFSWGQNTLAQLGSRESTGERMKATYILSVDFGGILGDNSQIQSISAGGDHTLALTHDGAVICWGNNAEGACGVGPNIEHVHPPQQVFDASIRVIRISAGYRHSLFLASDSRLFGVGFAQNGATGVGHIDKNVLYFPKLVNMSNLPPINASNIENVQIFAGRDRSFITMSPVIKCGGLSALHPLICSQHGKCTANNECACHAGYNGPNCEYTVCGETFEPSRVCSGHGNCTRPGVCECDPSYDGHLCDRPLCFGVSQSSSSVVCFGRGQCIGVDMCKCNAMIFGENCQYNMIPAMILGFSAAVVIGVCSCISLVSASTFCGVRLYRKYKRVVREKDMTRELLQGFIRDEEMDVMDADSQRAKFIVKQAMMEVDFSELKNLTKIASGGSGAVVFKGEWNGEVVAVKVFRSGMAAGQDNEVFFQEFEHELRLMSSLRHRNVISFLGCSLAFPRIALICEYCSQGSVEDLILKEKLQERSSNECLRMLLDIAEGCSYLHSRGVIHRDLKCANVLVDQNSVCRITDFGLAKYTKEAQNAHTTGIGTSYYIAPELWNGDGSYTESVDAYSFAILAMEMLLGRMCPFPGVDSAKPNVMQMQSRSATDPLYRPDLSELPAKFGFLKWMLQACWDHDSTKRPPFRDIVKILKSSLYDVDE